MVLFYVMLLHSDADIPSTTFDVQLRHAQCRTEEDCCDDQGPLLGISSFCSVLSRRGVKHNILEHNPATDSAFNLMPTVLITGSYCYADSRFLPRRWLCNHCGAYPRRDGQAELSCMTWLVVVPWTVTHLSTNPAWRRETKLMRATTKPNRQPYRSLRKSWPESHVSACFQGDRILQMDSVCGWHHRPTRFLQRVIIHMGVVRPDVFLPIYWCYLLEQPTFTRPSAGSHPNHQTM